MAFRLAHISDIHFGKIGRPDIVDALVEEVNDANVDLVCVSGDLTQRAKHAQFEQAREMLGRMRTESLVVPGNHDVFAWWYPIRRIMDPLRRYREYISENPTPSFVADGVAVLGINSATGMTIKGGHIDGSQRARMREFFSDRRDVSFNILVVHHHLSRLEALGWHDIARNSQHTLDAAVDAGVDLILCGHLHISHIEPIEIIPGDHTVVVASAGTATSTRGRKEHRRSNFFNLIDVHPDHFEIEERRFDGAAGRFVSDCRTRFERHRTV
ncbi:MAG: metallophosphoesterase [Rhodothermales bacterium]|nr:metallophosphoesterase [Rhodothermales bacterium]